MNSEVSLIFTLDYELPGNGQGDPYTYMVEPTYRLMDLMDEYKAKLTIMADVPEILFYKKYYAQYGIDKYHYIEIKQQLSDAIKRGHDVQLHIHPAYMNATIVDNSILLDINEYDVASLQYERAFDIVKQCKLYLETLLNPVAAEYKCIAFRACGWSMMPTSNIYKALVNNDIKVDSSVYKWGKCNSSLTSYDYSSAFSNIDPYKASAVDINQLDSQGLLTEYPIYCELRPIWYFFSLMRLYRIKNKMIFKEPQKRYSDNHNKTLQAFKLIRPWKYDFNQATSIQMIATLKRILRSNNHSSIVLIGHSKTFNSYNEQTLRRFLEFATSCNNVHYTLFR